MIKRILILCTVLCMTNMMAFAQAKSVDKGQRGHHVQKIQTMAKGLAVDGRVGTATMSALEKEETRFGDSAISRSHNGVPNKYVRVMTMHASAYSAQDPGNSNYTATGSRLKKGIVSVDPRIIPLGTKMFIEGYGYAVADDVGGAIKGSRIDLAFNSRAEALRFGRQTVKVYIL